MRKMIAILLVLTFVLSGCTQSPPSCITVAQPLDTEAQESLQFVGRDFTFAGENILAYTQSDHNTAVYIYSAPVEKSLNTLQTIDHDLIAYGDYFLKTFSMSMSMETPITISDGDNYARLWLPETTCAGTLTQRKNIFGQDSQAVCYANAFGEGVDLYCHPTSFGVNMEITLPKPGDTNTFQVMLQLPDLVPDTTSPDYILFKTALEKGVVRSIQYTPLLCDSKGHWSFANSVKLIEKNSETNTYTVEFTVDESFLSDPGTKYPVTLNQSLHLYKSKQPDTSAYENTGDTASHYLSPYMFLGDSTVKGEGWTYIRYETLNTLELDPDKIVSAKYVFRNLFDLDKAATVAAYAVTTDWCSINTRWFNRPPFDKRPISEVVVERAGDYKIDITPLLKEILKNKTQQDAVYTVQNSFFIRCDTANSNLLLASGDNGLFSPCLEIVVSK